MHIPFHEPNAYKMKKLLFVLPLVLMIEACWFPSLTQAESRYASDQIEVLLRTGPSHQHAIVRMLKSGAALEALEHDKAKGYTRVRTPGGAEGWVLTRHLMTEPSARELLAQLSGHFSKSENNPDSPAAQADLIRREYDALAQQTVALGKDNKQMVHELAKIRQTAANAVNLDSQNQEMRQQIVELQQLIGRLEQENQLLGNQVERDWFYAGALVLFIGLLMGLIIPRIQWRKRSRYGDF